MSLKPSRRGLLIGMGATAADAVLPVQANTRDDPMAYRAAAELVEALAKRRVSSRELVDSAIARIEARRNSPALQQSVHSSPQERCSAFLSNATISPTVFGASCGGDIASLVAAGLRQLIVSIVVRIRCAG